MIIFIGGCSHSGKTLLANALMKELQIPYLCMDHIKMGLIRSHMIPLTPEADAQLQPVLWKVIKEIAHTAWENKQNLIIEGCYLPNDWKVEFTEQERLAIAEIFLVLDPAYITTHQKDIFTYANVIEQRKVEDTALLTKLMKENEAMKQSCWKHGNEMILIHDDYDPKRLLRQAKRKIANQLDKVFETKRLLVRKMNQDDLEDLLEMLQDPIVMKAYEYSFQRKDGEAWLQRQLKRYEQDGYGLWALIRKEDGAMVGQAGLSKQSCEGEQVLEIGYLLKQRYWHQGYAREAAMACKTYAFEVLQAPEVFSIIKSDNASSKKVAAAIGMKKRKSFVTTYYHGPMQHDLYGIKNNSV